MSAAATVLSFRYRAPKPCCAINPRASKPVQHAQSVIDDGLRNAEIEMRAAGYDRETAQHIVRMSTLHFLDAFDGDPAAVTDVLLGLRDRVQREFWQRKIGTGGL